MNKFNLSENIIKANGWTYIRTDYIKEFIERLRKEIGDDYYENMKAIDKLAGEKLI